MHDRPHLPFEIERPLGRRSGVRIDELVSDRLGAHKLGRYDPAIEVICAADAEAPRLLDYSTKYMPSR
jgi:hypothetical protein